MGEIFIYYLNCFLLVLILTGKSGGKPKFGCPFCSACTPYMQDGELYSLGDLLELHQVFHFFFDISIVWVLFQELCWCWWKQKNSAKVSEPDEPSSFDWRTWSKSIGFTLRTRTSLTFRYRNWLRHIFSKLYERPTETWSIIQN